MVKGYTKKHRQRKNAAIIAASTIAVASLVYATKDKIANLLHFDTPQLTIEQVLEGTVLDNDGIFTKGNGNDYFINPNTNTIITTLGNQNEYVGNASDVVITTIGDGNRYFFLSPNEAGEVTEPKPVQTQIQEPVNPTVIDETVTNNIENPYDDSRLRADMVGAESSLRNDMTNAEGALRTDISELDLRISQLENARTTGVESFNVQFVGMMDNLPESTRNFYENKTEWTMEELVYALDTIHGDPTIGYSTVELGNGYTMINPRIANDKNSGNLIVDLDERTDELTRVIFDGYKNDTEGRMNTEFTSSEDLAQYLRSAEAAGNEAYGVILRNGSDEYIAGIVIPPNGTTYAKRADATDGNFTATDWLGTMPMIYFDGNRPDGTGNTSPEPTNRD